MPVMSQLLRRLGRWGATLALCSLANGASGAEKEWLDEMPSVQAVVQAVREQVEVHQQLNPALVGDEDYLAEMIAGNFTLLRWVMDFQSAKEWEMSDQRRKRMNQLAMDYMQVELAIGLGVGKRKGDVKRNCDRTDSDLNRLGQKMHTTTECYRLSFHKSVDNVYTSHYGRTQMFPRLFCDRAQYYLDLVQEQILRAPSPNPKPAETLSLPDGVQPLGPAVCKHFDYDSDRNKNGLCDDWEKPLAETPRIRTAAANGCRSPDAALDNSACLSPIKPGEFVAFVNNSNNEADKGFAKLRLVGPYSCIDAAAADAVRIVRRLADAKGEFTEFGLLIMKPTQIEDRYYFTVPVRGPTGNWFSRAVVRAQDYIESEEMAFLNLCDSSTNYRTVGNIHSHPTHWSQAFQSGFSSTDFKEATTHSFEKIFLVAPNGSNYEFAPEPSDPIGGPFEWFEYNNRTQLFSGNNVACEKSK